MNKSELIDAISGKTGLNKAVTAEILDGLVDTIAAALTKGDKLALVGFGTFETQHRAARAGRNPQTGAAIKIKAKTVVKFRVAKAAKDVIAPVKK